MSWSMVTTNIWSEITRTTKRVKEKCFVAVAYFGQNGSRLLPLKEGDTILVDASEAAVKAGLTAPAELLKLYNKGVKIFSHANLHAKIYVLGTDLYIGSANVSNRSANVLQEAVIKTNERRAIIEGRKFVLDYCNVEIGVKQIKALMKIYRPPKIRDVKGGVKVRAKSDAYPAFYTCQLVSEDWDENVEKRAIPARLLANKKRTMKKRHVVDEFYLYGREVPAPGSVVMQVVEEKDKTFVSPPGILIHSEKWTQRGVLHSLCYVEIPTRRRANIKVLDKKLDKLSRQAIRRQGKRSQDFAGKMYAIWK